MSWNDEQLQEFEDVVRGLQRDVAGLPLRGSSGGGGGSSVPRLVAALPAIPSGYDVVTWASGAYIAGGTGDNQVWECDGRVGQTEWTPRQNFTDETGVPV